jgi:ADP-sugar diphosphatase
VVLTVQPWVPAGSLEFVELPAGMLDDSSFTGAAAAKEIQEECGIEIPADELLDLTQLALGKFVDGGEEKLQTAVYPSPRGKCMRCCVGD